MKEQILRFLVEKLITSFLAQLSPEQLKVQLDNIIDSVEFQINASPNKFDDSLLPVLRFARDLFGIPDLPDRK